MHKGILVLIVLFIALHFSKGQNLWTDHFSYRNCKNIAESESFVAASSEMGLMVYNKLNSEIQKVSRVNGLSDVDITALKSLSNDAFIIGYLNGNIDLLISGEVYNIPDFKLKQIQGSKQINHFFQYNGKVYCSTDYALLVLDINKREVSDTYFLGFNAESLPIYETVVNDGYIYAATERGLLKADVFDPLIVYDQAWTLVSSSNLPYVAVSYHGNQIVSVAKQNSTYIVYYGNENGWAELKRTSSFAALNAFGGSLVVALKSQVERYGEDFNIIDVIKEYSFGQVYAQDAMYSTYEDAYFVADMNYGIARIKGDQDAYYLANGPYSNNCFDVHATNTGVYSTAGGITATYNNLNRTIEYSFFDNEKWESYLSDTKASSSTSRDLIRMCSSQTSDTVYMSTWGGGIYEVDGVSTINHYDENNSGLQDIFPDARKYVRVGGIASDSEGNIWMSNSEVNSGIVVKSGEKWFQFDYETTNNLHSTGQFLITKDDNIWIPIPMSWTGDKHGLMVINTNGTLLDQSDDVYKSGVHPNKSNDSRNVGQLQLWDSDKEVITNLVLSLAEDKNGYIWVGTDKGVLVYYRPWAIFSEDYPVASRIKVPRNDGSNLVDYLLGEERISAIAVDGANRKWIGTETSGLYLVSEDGLKTYQTFNVDNSPLPSNSITSLAISPITGEVFIGTAKGIVSYKAKATEGSESFSKVYAYPNPVREDFNGDITITGLMENSIVKITSVSGKLVYETTSLGGKAYWNGRNFNGQSVKTGVYLVYMSTEDGAQSAVTKILIVR